MTSAGQRTSVVLSGGGADGAFELGVLKALTAGRSSATGYRPLDPDVFAGTSIGAFNAAFLTSRWDEHGSAAVGELELAWAERLAEAASRCGNGAYRIRLDPRQLLDPRCYVDNPLEPVATAAADGAYLSWNWLQRLVHSLSSGEPLVQRTVELFDFASFVSPAPWLETLSSLIDYKAIRASKRKLLINATNWSTGKLVTYGNEEMSDTLGPLAIAASSALPGFYPPVSVGSQPFVDGGVLLNSPLRPAIRSGATVLHVIYLDPDIAKIPLAHLGNTLDTLYRMQQIGWAAKVQADIASARRINEVTELVREAPETLSPGLSALRDRYRRYSLLEVHCYSPREDYGGAVGLLNLARERIERLIEDGFEVAQTHNCEHAGCVLPKLRVEETTDAAD